MQVDLESLAAGYEHRPTSTAGLARAARAARSANLGPGRVAVDVGGGRGGHAAVWAEMGATAIVVDPSAMMTRRALLEPGVVAIRATAQTLPIGGGTVSLVYFHLSIHYGDWRRSIDEALRVLDATGECWIWTMGEEHHRTSFLTRWFPTVGDIDSERFPRPEDVVAYLEERTAYVETGREVEHKVMPAGTWRRAVAVRFVSTLQLISDVEFRSGLIAFDEAHPDPNVTIDYELTFDWIHAGNESGRLQ
jgi:ubiquinone/menaquinone biosynthesis C-methylase UbiE